jgi:hypothetical protein
VGLPAVLDRGLWWICLSSCNQAKPIAEVRELGLNILTFRRISSFNPPTKQLIKKGLLKLETWVASRSNFVWYSRILPVWCNFARVLAESSYSVGPKRVNKALKNSGHATRGLAAIAH